jgi:Fe-S-cluster containining protein
VGKWDLEIPPETVGADIKSMREEKGLSRRALAAQTNNSETMIRRIEEGKVEERGIVARVMGALGHNFAEYYGNKECNRCGDCCRVFSIRMPLKKDAKPADAVFFYNLHRNIHASIVKDGDDRALLVQIREPCEMLIAHPDSTTSCKVYWRRPLICKSFPEQVNGIKGSDMPHCSMLLSAKEAEGEGD